jgi:hypothetical protein
VLEVEDGFFVRLTRNNDDVVLVRKYSFDGSALGFEVELPWGSVLSPLLSDNTFWIVEEYGEKKGHHFEGQKKGHHFDSQGQLLGTANSTNELMYAMNGNRVELEGGLLWYLRGHDKICVVNATTLAKERPCVVAPYSSHYAHGHYYAPNLWFLRIQSELMLFQFHYVSETRTNNVTQLNFTDGNAVSTMALSGAHGFSHSDMDEAVSDNRGAFLFKSGSELYRIHPRSGVVEVVVNDLEPSTKMAVLADGRSRIIWRARNNNLTNGDDYVVCGLQSNGDVDTTFGEKEVLFGGKIYRQCLKVAISSTHYYKVAALENDVLFYTYYYSGELWSINATIRCGRWKTQRIVYHPLHSHLSYMYNEGDSVAGSFSSSSGLPVEVTANGDCSVDESLKIHCPFFYSTLNCHLVAEVPASGHYNAARGLTKRISCFHSRVRVAIFILGMAVVGAVFLIVIFVLLWRCRDKLKECWRIRGREMRAQDEYEMNLVANVRPRFEIKPDLSFSLPKEFDGESESCCICLDPLGSSPALNEEEELRDSNNAQLIVLPCGHLLHEDCHEEWMCRIRLPQVAVCPVCRGRGDCGRRFENVDEVKAAASERQEEMYLDVEMPDDFLDTEVGLEGKEPTEEEEEEEEEGGESVALIRKDPE